jgi:tetratricopeptide (TPR) repeat protein
MSYKRLGDAYRGLGKNEKSQAAYKEASKLCPNRAEALFWYVKYTADHKEAYEYGLNALKSVQMIGSDLFVDPVYYEWKLKFEVAIKGYYCDQHNKSIEMINELLDNNKVPEEDIPFAKSQLALFKKKHIPNKQSIIVIDDYLEDPDKLREFALAQDFKVKGNFPGARTDSFATDKDKHLFESLLGKTITYWPVAYNGSFQYVTEEGKTWLHCDSTDYGAILFLSKDREHSEAGTGIYEHVSGKNVVSGDPELSADAYKPEKWKLLDRIGHKYNRLVIFNGRKVHKAEGYFGKDLETSRLFQTFFFNTN